MMQQSIHQRAARCASCRMHDHARGLVDDNQIIVFKNHIQRDVFWYNVIIIRDFDGDFDNVTFDGLCARVRYHDPVHLHRPVRQQPRHAGSA